MEKINYGDINKFLVSVGIVLIALSVLTPYLYLKEDFGSYLESSIIEKFQEPVKNIILLKQSIVLKVQNIILDISLALFACKIIRYTVNMLNTQISYYDSISNHKSVPVLLIVF